MSSFAYFRHFATYAPATAALWHVPPGEALNRRFIFARLDDIHETVQRWVDLTAQGQAHGPRFVPWTDAMSLLPSFNQTPWPHQTIGGQPAGVVDAAFAAQRLVGPNPILLEGVTADGSGVGMERATLAARSSFSDADLQAGIASQGGTGAELTTTISQAIAARRLYVADLSMLADLKPGNWKGTQKFHTPTLALYWSRPGVGLLPVGIQVGLGLNAVIVPPGNTDAWREARAWFANGDVIHHEMWTHLGRAHLLCEQFVVLSRAELDVRHPVRHLLEAHFDGVLLNMAVGRLLLTPAGGMADQIISPVIQNPNGGPGEHGQLELATASINSGWVYDDLFPAKEVARRACDDTVALPHYGYRDDAIALFAVMRDYYGKVIHGIYGTGPVDSEAGAWVSALKSLHPGPLASLVVHDADTLADLVTAIAFLSSAFHAAVNYPQWDFTMASPNLPGGLYAPRGSSLNAMMPTVEAHIRQAEVMFLLAGRRFETLAATPALTGFVQERDDYLAALNQLEATLVAKNRPFPYRFLLPSLVPLAGNV